MQTATEILKKRKIIIVGLDGYGRIISILDKRVVEVRNAMHLKILIRNLNDDYNSSENKLKAQRLDRIQIFQVKDFESIHVDPVAVAINSYFMVGERKQREQTQKIVEARRAARKAQKQKEIQELNKLAEIPCSD